MRASFGLDDMTSAALPLIVALTGLPAAFIALWLSRSSDPAGPGMALRMALVAVVILAGALGMYWVAGDEDLVRWVVIAMVVAVNVLALSMWRHASRIRKGNAH